MAPQKAGRYELIEEVGRGAMGVVFRARDPLIGRSVAVKTLRLDDVRQGKDDPEVLERFQNEIRAAGRLAHPNIVVIHDAGADAEAGLFYITMELVQGRSLAKMLEEKQAFPIPRVLRIMEQACRALDYAHHNHIVHRDIKPANLLLGELDTVKLTDFGTAKILERGGTQSGQIVGTPSYMAPEQVKGRPVDGRADVFALAVILYELLTGERPFPGKNVTTVIYKIVHEEPLAPMQLDSSIHPGLNAVILRGLAKEPDDRYASCGDFLNALRTYRESQSSGAQTVLRRVSPRPVTRPVIAGQAVTPPPSGPTPLPDSPSQFAAGNPAVTTGGGAPGRSAPAGSPATPTETGRPVPSPRPAPTPGMLPPTPPVMPRMTRDERAQRKSSGGWLILFLLLAAIGTGGYFYREQILEVWHGALPQSKPASSVGAGSAAASVSTATTTPGAANPSAAPSAGTSPEKTWGTPGKGALDVSTDRPAAGVTLLDAGGNRVGNCRTPCRFPDLAPGTYTLSVKMAGLPTVNRNVEVREGRIGEELVHAPAGGKKAGLGTLELLSVPVGADILINGESTGRRTPSKMELPAGSYQVTLYLKGYAPYQRTVDVGQSRASHLEAMLVHQ